jgi:imidazolonepropionase-like amidohydrolase
MERLSGIRKSIAGCTLLIACISASAQKDPPLQGKHLPSPPVYVRCGILIADARKPPLKNVDVIIAGGKVTGVGPDLPVPDGAQIVDFSQFTVLPGLIDAHIHLWRGAFYERPPVALTALRSQKAIQYALSQGIVAVRVLGSWDFVDVALKRAVDEGTIIGPHVIPAAHAISTIGGHGDLIDMPWQFDLKDYYTPLHGFINSPAEAEEAVHLQLKYGARVIKVLASGGVVSPLDSPDAEQVSPEELKVIVEQAHMANVKVAAHAENIRSIMAALDAGVDSIEHGSELNQQAIDFMRSHHVYLDPTLFVIGNIERMAKAGAMPSFAAAKAAGLAANHYASFAMALRAGLPMAVGSDQLYEPGKGTVLDELVALVDHGMPPQMALTAVTRNNADLLSLPELGTVAAGEEGDLLAVQGDPLTNIRAIRNVRGVIFQGHMVPDWVGH